jgi:transposase-like protein
MNDQPGRRRTRSEIREIIEAYYASGQTQSNFAIRRGIGVSTLSVWLRREREQTMVRTPSLEKEPNLVEVSLSGAEPGRQQPGRQQPCGDFEIEFAGGERLRMRRGFLAEEFRVIVEVLRRQEVR